MCNLWNGGDPCVFSVSIDENVKEIDTICMILHIAYGDLLIEDEYSYPSHCNKQSWPFKLNLYLSLDDTDTDTKVWRVDTDTDISVSLQKWFFMPTNIIRA